MKKSSLKKIKFLLPMFLMVFSIACSKGGDDIGFRYGGGTNADPSENPTGGVGGAAGRGGTGGAVTGTGGSPTGTGGAPAGGTGGGTVSPAGTCEVDFNTNLVLKIDDAPADADFAQHYDSPPPCCQYAGARAASTCATSTTVPVGLLRAPSINTDLYCCPAPGATDTEVDLSTLGSEFSPEFVDSLFCPSMANNRHSGQQELAAARWKAVAGKKARLKFFISEDNRTCRVTLVRDEFPQFKIENSALDASILIDVGRDYGTTPSHVRPELNPAEVVGDCTVTPGTGGDYQVRITRLPLYFFVQLYKNRTKCLKNATTPAAIARCPAAAFGTRYADDDSAYQVIPGLSSPTLNLVTEPVSTPPNAMAPAGRQTTLSSTGYPLHFESASSLSKLKIVTTFSLQGVNTLRDDNAGSGLLQNQLDNALLAAELEGTITKAGTTTPIRTIADLKNCGATPTPTGGTGGSMTGTGGSGMGTAGTGGGMAGTGGSVAGTGGSGGSSTGTPLPSGLKLDQINPANSEIIAANVTSITYPEVPARGSSSSRLYRLSNVGTSPVIVNNLTVTDGNRFNFRVINISQGATYPLRTVSTTPDRLTIPVSGGAGTNDVFFFLTYGPQGTFTETTRVDSGILSFSAGTTLVSVGLSGTASNESRGQLALYIRDESRFIATGMADRTTVTTPPQHLYLPKNLVYSYRQDGSTNREVYIYNSASGTDPVIIQGITVGTSPKFRFDPAGGDLPTACFAADLTSLTTACAMNATLSGDQGVKIGKIIFTPDASPTAAYARFSMPLSVKASTSGRCPRIDGGGACTGTGTVVPYELKGVEGAPAGHKGLRINRLLAGFKDRLHNNFQKSLTVSSMTRGMVARYAAIGGSVTTGLDAWKDVFNLSSSRTRGAIFLDPVSGQVRLSRIATPLDRNASGALDMNNPASPSALRGVRLYNSPGSQATDTRFPGGIEYYPQCKDASGARCSFFYIFIGGYAASTRAPLPAEGVPAACQGKLAASPGYSGTPDSTVLDPLQIAQYTCIRDYNLKDVTAGYYDPVTGEITLTDIILRMFAPGNPRLSNANVDTAMKINFTTGCVTEDMVPPGTARDEGITVPEETRLDRNPTNPARMAFNEDLIPRVSTWPERSPLSNYIGNTHSSGCANGILHGRPLFMATDPTDTLDNAGEPVPAVIPRTFDIAGVGYLTSSHSEINPTNLYIIIKAEILDTFTE